MQQPLISIVMPVFNAGKFLDYSINSVLGQSYTNIELFITDDGSTDDTWEKLKFYAEHDRRVIISQLPHIGSPKIVRDYAICHSSGEWIVAVDSDDYIEKEYIEKIWNRHQETNADFVCPTMLFIEGKEIKSVLPNKSFNLSTVYCGTEAMLRTLSRWEFGANGALMNRKVITNLSTEEGSIIYNDECDTRIYLNNSNLVAFCDAKYYYTTNESSYTHAQPVGKITFELRNTLGLYRYFEKEFGYSSIITEIYRRKILESFQTTVLTLVKNGKRLKGTMTKEVKDIIVEAYSLFRFFYSRSTVRLIFFKYKMFLIRHIYYK